jgi:hypothetical protein
LKYALFFLFLTCTTLQAQTPKQPTIAYVRNGTEIRLIEPDGSNDRRLWTHSDAKPELGIYGVAWRPDRKELAFSSGHASSASLYHSDLYAMKPDGSGFRKLTNPPDRAEYERFPKGTVTVTVQNDQPSYQQTAASTGIFLVYVAGADLPQQITLPPGSSKTLVFKSVADFGNKAQAIVAAYGSFRWLMPGVDVVAGREVKAPLFTIKGDGIEYFGAFRPVWRSDSSRISFRNGACTLNSVPVNPPTGEFIFNPLFKNKTPLGACTWDWGPPALADQLIYSENASGDSAIYRTTEGGTSPGTKLTTFSDIEYQLLLDLHWLPDGSGLLYSTQNLMRDSANIFRYDFDSKQTTNVTKLENEFARSFSVSPDGKWIVFERAATADKDQEADLWIIGTDGKNSHLLVRNGFEPSW